VCAGTYYETRRDPTTTAVLAEDGAAVAGLGIAAACLAASHITGAGIYDAGGSVLVRVVCAGYNLGRKMFLSKEHIPRSIMHATFEAIDWRVLRQLLSVASLGSTLGSSRACVGVDTVYVCVCRLVVFSVQRPFISSK
jgi:hypothetical protein